MKERSYSELITIPTFEGRLEYLKLFGNVGEDTFGFDRIFNQMFYQGNEWRNLRPSIITRDNGCNLAHPDYEIVKERIIIHHMNPISIDDIRFSTEYLMNPEYLITTTLAVHNYIHYGRKPEGFSMIPSAKKNLIGLFPMYAERSKNDTCPWKK